MWTKHWLYLCKYGNIKDIILFDKSCTAYVDGIQLVSCHTIIVTAHNVSYYNELLFPYTEIFSRQSNKLSWSKIPICKSNVAVHKTTIQLTSATVFLFSSVPDFPQLLQSSPCKSQNIQLINSMLNSELQIYTVLPNASPMQWMIAYSLIISIRIKSSSNRQTRSLQFNVENLKIQQISLNQLILLADSPAKHSSWFN